MRWMSQKSNDWYCFNKSIKINFLLFDLKNIPKSLLSKQELLKKS